MNGQHRDDRYIIDLILAHAAKDKTESAYNRAAHLTRRAELLQEWADVLLHEAQAAATLVAGRRRPERPRSYRGEAFDAMQSLHET